MQRERWHSTSTLWIGALVCVLSLAMSACHSTVIEPSDHTHVFAPTDYASPCWALRRTWTGEYGADLFPDDQTVSIERATCFPLFRSTGTSGWNYDVVLPRSGEFQFELADLNPPARFTATIKTCGCEDTCGVGTSLFSLGAGPTWRLDLDPGGYCLAVFPPSPQSDDIYATVRASRP